MEVCAHCPSIIVISSDKCGPCQRFRPEINKLMAITNPDKTDHPDVCAFDLTIQAVPEVMRAFGVTQLPTVLIFEHKTKTFLHYKELPRDADTMIQVAMEQAHRITLPQWTVHPPISYPQQTPRTVNTDDTAVERNERRRQGNAKARGEVVQRHRHHHYAAPRPGERW
jgi:hypothetical protein